MYRKQNQLKTTPPQRILFICVHNTGRSQMAEAFFNRLAGDDAVAVSAGTRPAVHSDRNVREAMAEIGIDISSQRPKLLTADMLEQADYVISMGCGVEDSCPVTMTRAEDWGIDDPEGRSLEEVRVIRDAILVKVKQLLEDIKNNREPVPLKNSK